MPFAANERFADARVVHVFWSYEVVEVQGERFTVGAGAYCTPRWGAQYVTNAQAACRFETACIRRRAPQL
jgi:hypothetical protein